MSYARFNDVVKRRLPDLPEETRYLIVEDLLDNTTGETSDGYHTFDELYYYRMVYNAQAAQAWLADGIPVVKSWNHHDGLPCFGGGMFVVQAELPTGQVSNHYKAEHWDLFKVPEVGLPPVYDGHTPAIAADRMAKYIRTHTGNTLSRQEQEHGTRSKQGHQHHTR